MDLRPFTIPNLLTVARLVALPFLIGAIHAGRNGAALAIFLAASITDFVDGYLARHFGMVSRLGAYLDPIADKLFLVSTFVVFALPSTPSRIKIPFWLLGLLIFRDVALLVAGLVMLLTTKIRRFPPTPLGKATTFLEISTIVAIFLANLGMMSPLVAQIGFFVVAVCVLISGLHYVWRAKWLPRGEAEA